MSLFTALVLEFLSIALILLSLSSHRLANRAAAAFGIGASFAGFCVALGALAVGPGQLALSGVVPTALPTSVCFVILGSAIAWHGALDEIVDRRQLRAQVQRERDLFERVMETSPTAIILVNGAGQITFANSTAERNLRLSREQIVSRTYDAPAWEVTDFAGCPQKSDELAVSQVKENGKAVCGV